ncbi:hypothetical protein B0H11DRAFT_2259419 [Mycena galericulata]|nr:hypothetical protein B0H11DRAFT_2259419 [Mycena galericulata]
MSDSLMHSIWSKYTISPEPGMSTLRDTCVALLNHSLSSSDLVPALAGVAFHPWLAEPLREVIPALKHLFYVATQHREALFDHDHSDFRLATILGLCAEEVAGAWGRLKQKLASIMKCIEHICESHPRYCTLQALSALPSFAGESHCSLYTPASRSSPTFAPRKDFHSRQTDCTVEEFLDNGTVDRAEGVKPAKSCGVKRSIATHELYSGPTHRRSGGLGEELVQVGTGIAVEQAGAPAASKLYVDAGHMDERVSVEGESISEGLTEGSVLSPSSRGLETPPYQANICAPEDVAFAALLPLHSQDVRTALCKSSAVEHAGLNESLLENSAAARDSAILSRGSMEGQVAPAEHFDVEGGLQESPGLIPLRDSVSKLNNEDKSGRAPRSSPRLARDLSAMRSENCMIENGGLKEKNAKSAQSSTNFHPKGVRTFGTFTGIGVDSRVTNRATGDACAVVGLSAAVGSDRGDRDVDTIADGVDDPGVGSEGVTNEAMATAASVSKKEQDLQEGYARTSEESSYSLAPSIPAHERARDRANAKAARVCHSSTVLRCAGTEPLARTRTASLSFADVANKSAMTKPGGLKKSPSRMTPGPRRLSIVERRGAPTDCEEPANMPDIREMDMRGAEVHAPGASATPNRTTSAQNPTLARTETDALEAGGLKGSPDKSSKESREDNDAPETFTSIGEGRAIPISASEGAVHAAGAPKDHHGANTYIAVDVSAASGSAHDESDVDFCDDEGGLADEVEGLEEKEVKSAHSSEDSRANGHTLGIYTSPFSMLKSSAFAASVDALDADSQLGRVLSPEYPEYPEAVPSATRDGVDLAADEAFMPTRLQQNLTNVGSVDGPLAEARRRKKKGDESGKDTSKNDVRTFGICASPGNDGPAFARKSPAFSSSFGSPLPRSVILPAAIGSTIFALVSAIIWTWKISYLGARSLVSKSTPYRGWEREGIGTGRWKF